MSPWFFWKFSATPFQSAADRVHFCASSSLMDTVTHGIAGALLGKGYFSERHGTVATFAATFGAVFPDSDVVSEIFSGDPMAIVKYHRAITHSFVFLPFFALLFAYLTRALVPLLERKIERFRGLESPSFGVLTLIYAMGIASHIFLDGMTSFGTRMWFPISSKRVAWDLLFIIDFAFTALVLLPQLLAWIYPDYGNDVATSRTRAIRMWIVCTVGSFLVWLIALGVGYPFRLRIAMLVSVLLAVLFFAPAARGWGYRVTRAGWCQGGTLLTMVYLFCCALSHHAALLRAKAFADRNHIEVERIGALPIPPSLLDWVGSIRSPEGVYASQFDLRDSRRPPFRFVPDSPPDPFIARAFQLPDVPLDWEFARFPSINSFIEDGHHVVELGENRFAEGQRRGPQPFIYRVVFDSAGNVIEQGWLRESLRRRGTEPSGKNP
jgi:membrane-bound metal-dependent hydrolase YbcI (DUF457 family)